MSDGLHCDIHELLEGELQGKEANLEEIAAKVIVVLPVKDNPLLI